MDILFINIKQFKALKKIEIRVCYTALAGLKFLIQLFEITKPMIKNNNRKTCTYIIKLQRGYFSFVKIWKSIK